MPSSFGKEDIQNALRAIRDSSTDKDLVEIGAVRKVAACDGIVKVTLAAPASEQLRAQLRSAAESAIHAAARRFAEANPAEPHPVRELFIEFILPEAQAPGGEKLAHAPADRPVKQAASSKTIREDKGSADESLVPGVSHIIAVGAGKGGVGKSTIAVNLAVALARKGHAVGLLDGDIYGPSAPTLLGLHDMDVQIRGNMLQVFAVHGIKAMTIGKLVAPDKPLIWRGPMAHGAFKQLTEQTAWGELDYLIIDLPPGTGDVPLTMAQLLRLTGAVVVCTPQRVAQDDAVRAVRMFQQLEIPVLGIVENMSFFVGDDGKTYDIFGRGGAEQMAQRLGLPFLGAVPITMALRQNSDAGDPVANFDAAGPALRAALEGLADRVEQQAAIAELRAGASPSLTVS